MIKGNNFKNISDKKPGAIIYCRVSTKEQVDEGNSLVTQERLCRDYALKQGYEVVNVFTEEGESAKTALRPELQKLLRFCSANYKTIDALIIYKIDRLSRSADDYSQLRIFFHKLNIKINSTSETFENNPVGRFVENMLANVAQFDNDVRAERCKGGMIEAVRNGRYVFSAPIGYKNGIVNGEKNIIIDPEKAPFIKKIYELFATGLYQPEDVRKIIVKEGFILGKGTKISKQYFHKIIRNKVYKGIIEVKGFEIGEVKGSFEPIISEKLFDSVQFILERKGKRMTGYNTNNPDFPLRGLIKSENGHKLDGSWSKGNAKEKMPYYRFRGLNGFNTRRDVLEDKFVDFLKNFEFKSEIIDSLKNRIKINWEGRNLSNKKLKTKIEKNILSLKEKQCQIIDKNLKNIIDDNLAKEQLDKISNEISALSYELKDCGDSDNIAEVLDYSFNFLKNLSDRIKDLEIQQRKGLQWFLFPEGIIFDGKKLRTTKIPLILNKKMTSPEEKSTNVDLKGLEPLTPCLQSRCSSQLS